MSWKRLGSPTAPFEPSTATANEEGFPLPALLSGSKHNTAEQVVSRLSAAARRITREELGERRSLRSRSARLKPLRDISSDIQRGSTPHPRIKLRSNFSTQPEAGPPVKQASSSRHASPWPWFDDSNKDEDEKEQDLWAGADDPLLARSRPTKTESERIEQADIQRISLEEQVTLPFSALRPRSRRTFWRMAFSGLAILALAILAIDGLLLTFVFQNANHNLGGVGGPPTLILSSNVASSGEKISLQLAHFPPTTTVAVTHDIQQALFSKALVINGSGQASASFIVDATWNPGLHTIVAEDVTTRTTASTTLQVNSIGPSRPPHLLLDTSSLDLGASVQGADTIQPLLLRNSGSGAITWSASSDQPWLLIAPVQGVFSVGQKISVAAQRSGLAAGKYTGTITLSSNVGAPERLQVTMKVNVLPPNAGAMISLVPPLLSFTTMDGSNAPITQIVTLSNPGQQALHWILTSGDTETTTLQSAFLQLPGSQRIAEDAFTLPESNASWLSTDHTFGVLAPGQTIQLHLTVRSQSLLPGAYMERLTFSSTQGVPAYDTPQAMDIALTIQPHCGLVTSSGSLEFTAVAGQSNPSNQALSLNATASCLGDPLSWQAIHSASWITLDPASGQIKGTSSGVTSIGVNTAGLAPGKYSSPITILAGQSTQTVIVQLNLQPRPAPSEPILGASPLSLNFSAIQGQTSPTGQIITITNNGSSPLVWHTSITLPSTNWITVAPGNGTVLPGQIGQATVNIQSNSLTPGTYTGQVTLTANDTHGSVASGSPQAIAVSLVVQPPCTLAQPSQSKLLFSVLAGGANPPTQTVLLSASGSCTWPLQWNTNVSPAASWLTLTPSNGLLNSPSQGTSQQDTIVVSVNASGLQPGIYHTRVSLNALDSSGIQAQNSPQNFTITLNVLQPCTLQQLPAHLSFSAAQGQATPVSQTFTLKESGSCGGGVSWTALGNAGSSNWLSLSPTSGADTAGGSVITVSASASNLPPGTYTGQITVSASSNGVVLQGSPQTLTVTLQVVGYGVSGTIVSCSSPAPTCTTSASLSNATVSLVASDGTVFATATADAAGNFTFANVPQGTYTVKANGTVGTASYSGTTTVTISGDTSNVSVQTFSS